MTSTRAFMTLELNSLMDLIISRVTTKKCPAMSKATAREKTEVQEIFMSVDIKHQPDRSRLLPTEIQKTRIPASICPA
jgi:hypothetical protein